MRQFLLASQEERLVRALLEAMKRIGTAEDVGAIRQFMERRDALAKQMQNLAEEVIASIEQQEAARTLLRGQQPNKTELLHSNSPTETHLLQPSSAGEIEKKA